MVSTLISVPTFAEDLDLIEDIGDSGMSTSPVIVVSTPTSKLFNTHYDFYEDRRDYSATLLGKIREDGVTEVPQNAITAVHFVDLSEKPEGVATSDYSLDGDGSVLAWMGGTNGQELYIGGNGTIIASESFSGAFAEGYGINEITGISMIDTSAVTDMSYTFFYTGQYSLELTLDLGDNFNTSNVTDMTAMFAGTGHDSTVFTLDLGDKFDTSKVTNMHRMFNTCGYSSDVFTLDLGDKFDTSNVTGMYGMFYECGNGSEVFTLDLGDKFNTSKVTTMEEMFYGCGQSSSAFTTLDVSSFTVTAKTDLEGFAHNVPATTIILGDGWTNADWPTSGSSYGAFYIREKVSGVDIATTIVGAPRSLLTYNWAADNRTPTFDGYYKITLIAEEGGTVSGGGYGKMWDEIEIKAVPDEGYVFDGWYYNDMKVQSKAEITATFYNYDYTYTAKFIKEESPVVSKLFNTYFSYASSISLLTKIYNDGVTDVTDDAITAVHFVDLSEKPEGAATSDYSLDDDGSVLAWMGGADGKELYIGGNGTIIAGETLESAFYDGSSINAITGFSMLDTSNVTDMQYMFYCTGEDSDQFTLDLGDNFDTSNVTNMKSMFCWTGCNSEVFTLDLGDKFDTSKVTNMQSMFSRTGHNSEVFTLDLGDKFDTSNVTNMSSMFSECGYRSKVFTLDLGENFNTSQVKNMSSMFNSCGQYSDVLTLDLGGKFDTSKVEAMEDMFHACGQHSEKFTLDLGDKFDTSKVTTMHAMFNSCGTDSYVFTLDLGDKFDTSNVTAMNYMFSGCGESSRVFTLDLGNKFDTSKVTNMYRMFSNCGGDSEIFDTLDLSGFTVGSDVNVEDFARYMYVDTFIFGEGWANATLIENMFYTSPAIPTTVVGATPNLASYDWAADNRTATIEGNEPDVDYVAYDNHDNTYASLTEAVENAVNGSVITLAMDDTAEQQIIIDKSLIIDLNGNNLPSTVFAIIGGDVIIRDSKGTGEINANQAEGFNVSELGYDTGFELDYRVSATIVVTETANVSINNVKIYNDGGYDLTKAIYLGGGEDRGTSLVLNHVNLVGDTVPGSDAIFFYNNEGSSLYMESVVTNDCVSVWQYPDTTKFVISSADIDTDGGAFWVEYGSTGSSSSGYIKTQENAEKFLANGSYFVIEDGESFDYKHVVVASDLAMSDGYTEPEYGSSDEQEPAKVVIPEGSGEAVEIGPQIIGGKGEYLYQWYKNDVAIEGATGPTLSVTEPGTYKVVVTDSLTGETIYVYWLIVEEEITHTVLVIAQTGGSASASADTVKHGKATVLTATVNDGYTFGGWYDGDEKISDSLTYSVIITENKTFTAKFIKDTVYYTITATAEANGAVSGGGEVAEGESVTLTAIANEGYVFAGWYDGDTKVSDSTEFVVENVTANKTYTAKFEEAAPVVSKLFNTNSSSTLFSKIRLDGVTTVYSTDMLGLHFVDLSEKPEGVATSDYSLEGDGSVLAWMGGTRNKELYIGGNGTIIAGESLSHAFENGYVEVITGLSMLDTSAVTDMSYMFNRFGYADNFTLDLGDNFDTSNVTNMSCMFSYLGRSSNSVTLDLGTKFDTSKVTSMRSMFSYCGSETTEFNLDLGDKFDTSKVMYMNSMFYGCGKGSTNFTTLDVSGFYVNDDAQFYSFAANTLVTTFIFGDGWNHIPMPEAGEQLGAFYTETAIPTTVVGATKNILAYDWEADNRTVTFEGYNKVTVDKTDMVGGTVKGGGMVADGGSITLTATPDEGYVFAGWYDGDTKVSDSTEFVVENVTSDKTYTARFEQESLKAEENTGDTAQGSTDRENPAEVIIPEDEQETVIGPSISGGSGTYLYQWYKDGVEIPGATSPTLSVTEPGSYMVEVTDSVTGQVIYVYWIIVKAEPTKYVITGFAANGGSITGGGEVAEGESVTLTATANDGYTFLGWYDGDVLISENAQFVVENVTANKTYIAKFEEETVVEPDTPEVTPPVFDFTSIRTLRASNIVIDHQNRTITMDAEDGAKNIVVYHAQTTYIPGGQVRLADAKDAEIVQNSGSFYITNNAESTVVDIYVTIDGVTETYTVSVAFNAFVADDLRVYQRKVGSTASDIIYGTDVGYIVGNTIYISADAGVEYIGLTKHQGKPGNYTGIITPATDMPAYSTAAESSATKEYLYADYNGCIFIRRPADTDVVEFEVNYEKNGETTVYNVIVDYTASSTPTFDFGDIRAVRIEDTEIDHVAQKITVYAEKGAKNIAIYNYQAATIEGGRITLGSGVSDENVTDNTSSFYVANNGQETTTVMIDVKIADVTKQYELTVVFPDGFDFTDIRGLRTKNVSVDHTERIIELTSTGLVQNIAIYKGQTTYIPNGNITLADALDAEISTNAGSFYVNNVGKSRETLIVNVEINGKVKQYTLIVNFSDGFDFEEIRALRTESIMVDHSSKKISIIAKANVENVTIYGLQTGVINSGKITLKDKMDASIKENSGSFYILPPSEGNVSTLTVDVKIGDKTETYEIVVNF